MQMIWDLIWKVLCRRSLPKKQSAQAWPTQSRSRECAHAQGDWDGHIYARKGEVQSKKQVQGHQSVARSLRKIYGQEILCFANAMWMVYARKGEVQSKKQVQGHQSVARSLRKIYGQEILCFANAMRMVQGHLADEMLNIADGSRWCVHAKVSLLWRHQLLPLMARLYRRWPEFQSSSQKVLGATRIFIIFASRRKLDCSWLFSKTATVACDLDHPHLCRLCNPEASFLVPFAAFALVCVFILALHDELARNRNQDGPAPEQYNQEARSKVGFIWCTWRTTHFGARNWNH